jgi:hypothetical protein
MAPICLFQLDTAGKQVKKGRDERKDQSGDFSVTFQALAIGVNVLPLFW